MGGAREVWIRAKLWLSFFNEPFAEHQGCQFENPRLIPMLLMWRYPPLS